MPLQLNCRKDPTGSWGEVWDRRGGGGGEEEDGVEGEEGKGGFEGKEGEKGEGGEKETKEGDRGTGKEVERGVLNEAFGGLGGESLIQASHVQVGRGVPLAPNVVHPR